MRALLVGRPNKKRLFKVLIIGKKFPKFNFLEKEHKFSILELILLGTVFQVIYEFFKALFTHKFFIAWCFIFIIAVNMAFEFFKVMIKEVWKDLKERT